MSTKRGKLTAGKARERVASLEESISARQHRLDQLEARLERSESPDERLLTAKSRLERRLDLEKDQLEKLVKLLGRDHGPPEESGEFFASEEIDDLHRSFEEVRQNLAQMQARIESSDLPRDLTSRLSSFEERVARREEVDSELFAQVMSLQTALDQERQAVRRLSRRTREQDQSLDALREAVEDSVVATVDLAERLEELEEAVSDSADANSTKPPAEDDDQSFLADEAPSEAPPLAWSAEIEMLRELVDDARRGLVNLQRQVVDSVAAAAAEREDLRLAQKAFAEQQSQQSAERARDLLALEKAAAAPPAPASVEPRLSSEQISALFSRLEALESAAKEPPAREATFSSLENLQGRTPAVFANGSTLHKRVALFGESQAISGPKSRERTPVKFGE